MAKAMRFFSLVFFFGILFSFTTFERDKKYIYWDERAAVTWEDFKGRAPGKSPYAATTSSAIQFGMSGSGKTVQVHIYTIFDPKTSWKKKEVTEHLLNHEQGHFDITEIYSRIFRKEVQETKFKKYENIGADLQRMYNKNYNACAKFQDLYDKETDHSRKKEIQLNWDTKIQDMLDSLSAWSNPELTLDVSYLF